MSENKKGLSKDLGWLHRRNLDQVELERRERFKAVSNVRLIVATRL